MIIQMWKAAVAAVFIAVVVPVLSVAEEITVVASAISGVSDTNNKWQPTIAYLQKKLPHHHFRLLPMPVKQQEELRSMVDAGAVDFIITQPAIYVDLELSYGISHILTLLNKDKRSQFGSVIIARSDSTIRTVDDIRGRRIAGVVKLGFGGWLIGYNELLQAGLDAYSDCEEVIFTGVQEKVVQAVLAGEADAGIIRTGIIEKMISRGQLNKSDLFIINKRNEIEFPEILSSELYSEWAFAKTKEVNQQLAKEVVSTLLSMPEGNDAAREGEYWAWTIPLDYQPVHALMKKLRAGPYSEYGKVTITGFLQQHKFEAAILLLFMISILCLLMVSFRLSHLLKRESEALKMTQFSISHAADPVFWFDPDARVTDVNQAACDALGCPGTELLSMTMYDFDLNLSKADWSAHWDRIRRQGSITLESAHRDMGGKVFPVEITVNYFQYDNKEYGCAFARDITERKRMEKNLLDSQLLAESQKYSRKLIQSQEDERRYIAHELHDEIGQDLTVINTLAMLIARQSAEEETIHRAQEVNRGVMNVFEGFRTILNKISPHWIDSLGLIVAVESLIGHWGNSSGVNYKFNHSGALDELPDLVNIAVYRIVQECLTNVSKHASAGQVEVDLSIVCNEEDEEMLKLEVHDNGQGVDMEQLNHKGLGINGICERARALNGKCLLESSPGKGMFISILIPLCY